MLLELVERDHSRAKTQTNELMTAADRKHRSFRLANEVAKVVEDRLLVVIKIAQRAAEHDRVGLKTFRRLCDFGKVRHFGGRAVSPDEKCC